MLVLRKYLTVYNTSVENMRKFYDNFMNNYHPEYDDYSKTVMAGIQFIASKIK